MQRLYGTASIQDSPSERSIVLMQPYFWGWLGYYELFFKPTIFVYLDDFAFRRRGRGQSNKLFIKKDTVAKFTLPVSHTHNIESNYFELSPLHSIRWIRKTRESFKTAYGRALYYEEVMSLLDEWFSSSYKSLADMLIHFDCLLCHYLGISRPCLRSSELNYDRTLPRSEKLYALSHMLDARRYYATVGAFNYLREDNILPCSDLEIVFQDFHPQPYPQVGSSIFVSHLSALDALFNISPEDFLQKAIRGTPQWLSWGAMSTKMASAATDVKRY